MFARIGDSTMMTEFIRTEILLGEEAMERLRKSSVAIFGIGGVGSYVVEALARCGVGRLAIFDHDIVSVTNINRQLIATNKTVGRKKVEIMAERIKDINPDAIVDVNDCFYLPENADEFPLTQYDYIVDAVDTVAAKLELIVRAKENNIDIISSMGAGNKLNPADFQVADIYKTSVDPLAKVMRHELRKREIKDLKVVYSKEEPIKFRYDVKDPDKSTKRSVPGSISFVPSVAGLIIASEVVKDLVDYNERR
jgi:tRNA A37 threonylcarbamoyladenosine dehydratase